MGILKLKNSVIVAVLLSVSNGYCANGTIDDIISGDDSVSHKPRAQFQTPPLERRVQFQTPTLERRVRFQTSPLAGEDAGLVGNKTKYAIALEKFVESEQQRKISRKQFESNIIEAIQALQPANLAPTISPVSTFLGDGSDSSDSDSDKLVRDASPFAESPTTPSTPSSLGGSSDTDSTYVSDSDDEEPKIRGFISRVLDFFWWRK